MSPSPPLGVSRPKSPWLIWWRRCWAHPFTISTSSSRNSSGWSPCRALLGRLATEDCLPRSEVDSLLKSDGRLEMLVESEEVDNQGYLCPNLLGTLAAKLLEAPACEWPPATKTLPEKKVQLEPGHHRPRGWEGVVNSLVRNPFVTRIRYDAGGGIRRGIFEASDNPSDLFVVISDGETQLPLRVSTTAENPPQRRLVQDHLRERVALP